MTTPITLPEKLTEEQADRLLMRYKHPQTSVYYYFRHHLLRDLAEILKPEDKWAKEKEAFAQGKRIQWRRYSGPWLFTEYPGWYESEGHEYRIAPDEPWTPKVGDWVTPKGMSLHAYKIQGFDGKFYHAGKSGTYFYAYCLRPATAEEIAAAKAKIKAEKLAELERETEAKRKQIEEECK